MRSSTGSPAWITWEPHRRSREIARSLRVPLAEWTSAAGGLARYPSLILRTAWYLLKQRPTHVFFQCPSVVLGLWILLLKPLLRYTVIADLHNEAIDPFVNTSRVYRWILRRLHREADLSVVSNAGLCGIVEANGGRPFVLPDRVPEVVPVPRPATENGTTEALNVVFVCTFAADEPYTDVFEAARLLSDRATVHVTGRRPRGAALHDVPQSVRLTDYLPDAAYLELLARADVVMDLTAMANCLVCGGYEAVALAKPLVTSDTDALRAHFRRGTVFTRHDPVSIAAAVGKALDERTRLAHEMQELRVELETEWALRRSALIQWLTATPARWLAEGVHSV